MPPFKVYQPASLEDQCLLVYIHTLKSEAELIFHLRAYETKSVLLKNLNPDVLFHRLQQQFVCGIHGILQDMIRQKIVDILLLNFHNLITESMLITRSCRSFDLLADRLARSSTSSASPPPDEVVTIQGWSSSITARPAPYKFNSSNLRYLPLFQQLLIILNSDVKVLDFSDNREWIETEETTEFCRMLWKIIGERCKSLERLVLTKELTYSSTLNNVIVNGSCLVQLTLKRNVPNNIFLNLIGTNCPKLQELDVAGAEILNDFGIVCLLYSDPEQIFIKCWNRERTVGQVRRSMRAFPQPYYDRQIHDQQEQGVPRTSKAGAPGNFLYLKKSFHEALKSKTGDNGDWERLPIASSLKKIRLENTKVKGDGASVILESCPIVYSLGYLVFAAAGLKQVFGYEDEAETKMTEIFYRGPSEQKLHTISNCCPKLKTLFLGSNNPRAIHSKIFRNWTCLSALTLENIVVESVISCLEVVGLQIKGLKLQCTGLNLPDIAVLCPKIQSLIIQKESPNAVIKCNAGSGSKVDLFGQLVHLEVSSPQFSKPCMEFVLSNALRLESIKILHIPKLLRTDLETWFATKPLNHLHTLIIFKGPSMTLESTLSVLGELPSLTEIGISDLNLSDAAKSADLKKLQFEMKKKEWDLNLVDFGEGEAEERDFTKLQNLHWFYLSPSDRLDWP